MRNINERKKLMYFALVAVRCVLGLVNSTERKKKKISQIQFKKLIKAKPNETIFLHNTPQVKIGHCMINTS